MEKKSISEFLSNEYKEFAMYTIENRAIPSVIDGFKTSQRKIIHVSNGIWKSGSEKSLKVFQLAGKVASDAFYHHGNCLDGDTKILLSNGAYVTFKEWIDFFPNDKYKVVSYDIDTNEYVEGIAHSPRIGKITNTEYIIETEDGEIHKCTGNQPYLTQRGWVQAEDLTENDEIISKPQ